MNGSRELRGYSLFYLGYLGYSYCFEDCHTFMSKLKEELEGFS